MRIAGHIGNLPALILLAALMTTPAAWATDITWIISNDGDYETGANWIGGSAPADTADGDQVAYFPNPASGTWNITLNANRSVYGMKINPDSASGDFYSLDNAGSYTMTLGEGGLYTYGSGRTIINWNLDLSVAQTWTNTEGSVTNNGTLIGSFRLTKRGAGTLHLLADNSGFSGGITASNGTVKCGHANSLGTGTLILQNGAGLASTATMTFTNSVECSGTNFLGAGAGQTLTLSGPVSLTGDTIFDQDSARTVYISGNITGGYNLTLGGSSLTLRLQGNNSYSGLTKVTEGVLVPDAGSGNAIPGNLTVDPSASGACVTWAADNRVPDNCTATVNGAGYLELYDCDETIGALEGSGSVCCVSNASLGKNGYASTLTINKSSGTSEFSGALKDKCIGDYTVTLTLVKEGAGTQALTGTNTYGGSTTVNGGALIVNGLVSNAVNGVTVNSGGTLGGTGRVLRAVSIGNEGALSPGDGTTMGTLTTSNLTLAAGCTNLFDLGAVDASDKVAVSGDFTLNGVFSVTQHAGFGADTYEIMTYTGSLTPGTTSVLMPEGYEGTLDTNTPNKVYLVVTSAAGSGTMVMFQ